MSETERERGKTLAPEDVDDVVGIASELEREAEGRLDVGEMEAIAEELRIDPKYVEPAIARLERERAEARAASERARVRRRALGARALVAFGALVALFAFGAAWTRASLGAAFAEVERTRAQVESVRARQAETEALFGDREPSRGRDAELVGALNRVGIERRRYDEAAAAYNARASGLLGALFCGGTRAPCRAPTSAEIAGF